MKRTAYQATRAFGQRRLLLIGALGALTTPLWATATPDTPLVEVWKSPTCGCCDDWMRHLEANGFRTKVYNEGNATRRARMGVAPQFGSCHTAVVAGYAIEGHVPAREIRRLLKERPAAIGLAVPGMPVGSPGMDGAAYAGRKDPYEVILLMKDGRSSVYQAYT
jgi:hypothetical protein